MAEAYGKLTGEPGVLLRDARPGRHQRRDRRAHGCRTRRRWWCSSARSANEFAEREAFQEIDYRRMYGQMAKWVAQIDRVERIPST
jgi:acetolactate synthase-1/2/3 large subunit